MTPEQIDQLLWCLMGKPKKRKAFRFWYARLMAVKGQIVVKPSIPWPDLTKRVPKIS